MKKSAGNVKVTIEEGHCSFCDRARNLRREERQLGGLVRVVVTCESCHRTLTSSMGLPAPATAQAEAEPATTALAGAKPKAQPKPAPVRAPVATRAKKPGATAGKPAAAGATVKKPATKKK